MGGLFEGSPKGVPQGGPLSPLLGNIMLNECDHELERRVTSVLVGASKVSQIEDNVAALKNLAFSKDELDRIEEILK